MNLDPPPFHIVDFQGWKTWFSNLHNWLKDIDSAKADINVDGGNAAAVYTASQLINGGAA